MRWTIGAGGALLVSVFAHAMVAVTVAVLMRSMTRGPVSEPDAVDLDVAVSAQPPGDDSAPKNEAFRGAGGDEPVPRRFVPLRWRKRTTIRSREAADVTAPSTISGPVETNEPARFALRAGTVATGSGAMSAVSFRSPSDEPDGENAVIGELDVDRPARLLSASPLVYPPVARKAEIEIDFPVEIVVDRRGRVETARAVSAVGYGLDEAALRAIRAYRFSPALRAGRAVRVRMRWTVQFRLR